MSYRSNFLKSKTLVRKARTTVVRRKRPVPCPRPVPKSSDQDSSSVFGSATSTSVESSSESRDPVASFRDDDLLRPSNDSCAFDDRLPLDFIISGDEAEGRDRVSCSSCPSSETPSSAVMTEMLSNSVNFSQSNQTATGKSLGRGQTRPKLDRNPGRAETADDNRPKISGISSNGEKPSKHLAQGADAMVTHSSAATPPPPSGVNQTTSGRIVPSVTPTLPGCSSLSRIPVLERSQEKKAVKTARSTTCGNESPRGRTETRTNTPDGSVSGRTFRLTQQINSAVAKHAAKSTAAPQKGGGTTAPSGVSASRVSALVDPARKKASLTSSKVSTLSSGGSSGVTVQNMDSSRSVQTQTSDTSQTTTTATTVKNETRIPVYENRNQRPCVLRSEAVRRRDTLTANRTTPAPVTRLLREKTSPEAASIDHVTKASVRRGVSRIPVPSNGFRRSNQVQQPSHVKCQDATTAAGGHHQQQQQQQQKRPPVPPLRLPQALSNTSMLSGSLESPPSTRRRSPFAPPKQPPPPPLTAAADWSPLALSLTQRTELLQPWIQSLARALSPSIFSDELSLTGYETDAQSNASEVSRRYYLGGSVAAAAEHRLLRNGAKPKQQTTRNPSRPFSAIPDLPSAVALLTTPIEVVGGRRTKGSLSGVGRSESFNFRLRNRSNCTCPDSRTQGLSSPDVSGSAGKTGAGEEQSKRRFRPASFDVPSPSASDAFAPSPRESVPRPATGRCCPPPPAVADAPAKPVAAKYLSLDTCSAHFSVYNVFSIVNVASNEERLEEIRPAALTKATAEETTENLGVCCVNEKLVCLAPSGDRSAPEKDRTSAMEQRAAEARPDSGRPLIIKATAVSDEGHLAFMSSARDDGVFGRWVTSALEDELLSSGSEAKHSDDDDEAAARADVTCRHSSVNTGPTLCIRKPHTVDVNGINQCNELVVNVAEVRFCGGEAKNSVTELPDAGEVITVTEYKDSATGINLMERSIAEQDLLPAEVKNSTKKTLIPVMKVVSVFPTVVISTSASKTETNKQKKRAPVNHPPTRRKEEEEEMKGEVEERQTYEVVDVTFTDLDSSAFAIQQIAESDVRRDRNSSKETLRSGTSGRKCRKVPSVDTAVERQRQKDITLQALLQLLQTEMLNEQKTRSISSSNSSSSSSSSDSASERHSHRRLQLPVVSSRHDDLANRTVSVEAFDRPPTADGGGSGGVGPFPLGSSVTQIFTKRRRGPRRRETATVSKSEWSTALFAKTLYFEDEATHRRTRNKTTTLDDVIDGRRSEGRLTTTTTTTANRFHLAAAVKQNRAGGGGGRQADPFYAPLKRALPVR